MVECSISKALKYNTNEFFPCRALTTLAIYQNMAKGSKNVYNLEETSEMGEKSQQ